jgi:urea transport system substrate-binding protein
MKGSNILIVEDNIDLRNLTKLALEKKGHKVICAENGKVALDFIEKQGIPDLILLDMKMPVMDGWEFAQEFGNRFGRSAPIVVMTAAEDSKKRAMEIGADSYIGKPFELAGLYGLVESVLG